MRRPVQLEESEESLCHTGQREPQRGAGVSPPQGARDNLACSLKLLAITQTDEDSLVDALCEGF